MNFLFCNSLKAITIPAYHSFFKDSIAVCQASDEYLFSIVLSWISMEYCHIFGLSLVP